MAIEFEGVSETPSGKCRIRWYEGTTAQGKPRRRSEVLEIPATALGKKRAYKIRAQRIKQYQVGDRDSTRGSCPTFGKLAQLRLDTGKLSKESRRTNKIYLNRYWMPRFGNDPMDVIHYDDLLEEFAPIISAGNLSPKTLKHVLSAGSAVFQLAIKSRWIHENPARLLASEIELPTRVVDPFTREERDILLDSLQEHQHIVYYTIRFFNGLRPSEAIALRWSDYKDGNLVINKGRVRGDNRPTPKNKIDRVVPAHPRVVKILRETPRQLHNDHIVTTQHGSAYQSSNMLAQALKRTMKRTGIRYRSPYNARHTCATMMLEAEMSPAYCAKMLGHTVEMFLKIYADFIDKELKDAQARKWASI